MHAISRLLVPVLALLAAGCASRPAPGPNPDTAELLSRIETLREEAGASAPSGTGALEAVRLPLGEAWLDAPLSARYARLPAEAAVRLLAQGRPVRFDLSPGAVPVEAVWPEGAGTIREHLDAVAAQADWSWSFADGVLAVRDIETRHFMLQTQPGATQAALGLRNLGGAGGSSDNRMILGMDPYAGEIAEAVGAALRIGAADVDARTTVSIAPSANMLVVTAKPSAMRGVERIVALHNRSASRIVRISLSVFEVAFSDEEKRDLALDLIRRSADVPVRLLINETLASFGAPPGAVLFDRVDGRSRHYGSSAVLQWLDTFGDTSISYDDTIEVLNNHVASVEVVRNEDYISSVTREVDGESGEVSIEIRRDELRTGLAVHLQPSVAGSRITLRLGLSRSDLVDRRPFSFGTGAIEGENFTTDNFNRMLSVVLEDGEPRLLASLSSSRDVDTTRRVPFLGFLGTGRDRQVRRHETVMLIEAEVTGG